MEDNWSIIFTAMPWMVRGSHFWRPRILQNHRCRSFFVAWATVNINFGHKVLNMFWSGAWRLTWWPVIQQISSSSTPRKINMEPKNHPIEIRNIIKTKLHHDFRFHAFIFQGASWLQVGFSWFFLDLCVSGWLPSTPTSTHLTFQGSEKGSKKAWVRALRKGCKGGKWWVPGGSKYFNQYLTHIFQMIQFDSYFSNWWKPPTRWYLQVDVVSTSTMLVFFFV